jgi:hypothetical protein
MKTNYINQLQREMVNPYEITHNQQPIVEDVSIESTAELYATNNESLTEGSDYDIRRESFIAGANEMLPIIKELGEALKRIANRTNEDDIFETDKHIAQTTLDKYKQYL